jgi:hypothetical protein
METGGEAVTLNPCGVPIRRGTIRNGVNSVTRSCMIAFMLVSAKPVIIGARPNAAIG